MALDFPNSPSIGAIYSGGGGGGMWQWDGAKWESIGVAGASRNVTVSDTAPTTPNPGDMWFDSVGLQLYVYYQDPTSSQWVPANNLTWLPPSVTGTGGTYVLQTNPTILTPVVMGVTDGSNAIAGAVGEYIQAIAPNNTSNVNPSGGWFIPTSVNLTPGDWDLEGMAYVIVGGPISNYAVMLSTNNSPGVGWPPSTNPFSGVQYSSTGTNVLSNSSLVTGVTRFSFAVATVVYLHWLCTAASASTAYAAIRARRVR